MMRNALFLLILFVFVGCNSKEAALTSIQGLRDPNNPQPKIVSILPQGPGTYNVGSGLDFYVTYDEVVVVDGAPRLPITLDSGTYYADYISGSGTNVLYFQFAVPAGAYDYNGIQLTGKMTLNGGSIYDPDDDDDSLLNYSIPSTSGVFVNGINPVITSVTIDNGNYKIDDTLEFTVNYSFPVYVTGTPRLPMTINVSGKEAVYVSGSGTSALKFTYAVEAIEDYNGIAMSGALGLVGATITDYFGDPAGSAYGAITFGGVIVDGITPAENARAAPGNGYKIVDSMLIYIVNYNEVVNVTGNPRVQINIGGTTRYANYYDGTGTSSITYLYTVVPGEIDTDGITEVKAIDLNGGTIKDRAGNPISTVFMNWNAHTTYVDSVNPTLTAVGVPSGNYKIGDTIQVFVTTSENVTVTGVPSIGITIGSTTKQATYFSGSGTTLLTFKYVVEEGLQDSDGVTSVSPVALNGGTIRDAATNNAVLSFTAGTYATALVDAVRPTIAISMFPTVAPYAIWRPGNTMSFTVTASENILVSGGTPSLPITVGSNFRAANMNSTTANSMTFTYTVQASDLDLDGITLTGASLISNGATIKDAFGNSAVLSLAAVDMSRVFVLPSAIKYWFDANDTLTTTGIVNAPTFKSKADAITPSLTGDPPALVTGPNGTKFAQFTGANNFTLTMSDADVVIVTLKTPTATGHVWREASTSSLRITFDLSVGNRVFTGGGCFAFCEYYYMGAMNFVDPTGMFSPYGYVTNTIRTIAVDFKSPGSHTYKIGEFNGQIAEMIILSSGAAISGSLIQNIGDYFNTKHGAVW